MKSEHFQYYAEVVAEFAKQLNIDPWLIAPLFRHCGEIDFMQQEGMECLIANAEMLFAEIQKKYDEYHIPHQPFLNCESRCWNVWHGCDDRAQC